MIEKRSNPMSNTLKTMHVFKKMRLVLPVHQNQCT